MMIPFFADAEAPLAAQTLTHIGGLAFTNSMLYGLITAVFVLAIFVYAAKASQLWPKSKFAFWFESIVELVLGLVDDIFGDRKKTLKHFPLLISLFVFILACNLSGLLPGVGTLTYNGVSFLRAWTTDLNSTLALAILVITTVQVYAIKELGIAGHIKHYFSNIKNPINLFIGVNEVFGELLRLVTLSLRLFGVIYGGEALLHAIAQLAGNFAWAATLPIMFLEIFFSIVQAYLFMMLTATYLSMATRHEDETGGTINSPAAEASH